MDRNFPSLTQSENRPKKRNRCPRRRWQVLFFLGFKITWNNELAQNWRRSTSGLYIVTLLVKLLRREHHAKCWAGGSASWNRDEPKKIKPVTASIVSPSICTVKGSQISPRMASLREGVRYFLPSYSAHRWTGQDIPLTTGTLV